jgi:hypothetical protein
LNHKLFFSHNVAGFAKTILTHSPKLKRSKDKKVIDVIDLPPLKRRKRCKTCHNYSARGHKKICTGVCEDFDNVLLLGLKNMKKNTRKEKRKRKKREKKKQK